MANEQSLQLSGNFPRAGGERRESEIQMKCGELTWPVSDVEADEEKAKGLKDEVDKGRVKAEISNLQPLGCTE
ncbi:uncharacterized protein V6R79_015294 [Siganus canaliculatus]